MGAFVYLYIVWSTILFGIIAMEEVLTRKHIETSERHSRFLPGFSGGLYGRITHHSNA